MRRAAVALLILALAGGCSRAEPKADSGPGLNLMVPPALPIPPIPEGDPVVLFRIHWVREGAWFFVASTEDLDLTLEQADELGIPVNVWRRLRATAPGERHVLFLVRRTLADHATKRGGTT